MGRATRTSHQQILRFERGELATVNVEDLGAWCGVVGLDLAIRAYPGSDAIRDAGQQRLLGRLRRRIDPTLEWLTEVPIGVDGDLRAWDAMIVGSGSRIFVEAETVLDDLQAAERRIALKAQDSGASHVLVIVADTRGNRRALGSAPTAFGGFDRNARRVFRCLRAGVASMPARALVLL